jgi:hypothetical protein
VERVVARLGSLRGVRAVPQGSQQVRLELDVRQGLSAVECSRRLRERDPAILAWDLHAEAGVLVLTLGKVDDAAADVVCDAIAGLVEPSLAPAQ